MRACVILSLVALVLILPAQAGPSYRVPPPLPPKPKIQVPTLVVNPTWPQSVLRPTPRPKPRPVQQEADNR